LQKLEDAGNQWLALAFSQIDDPAEKRWSKVARQHFALSFTFPSTPMQKQRRLEIAARALRLLW
jgi:hypothetical protein